jgi:hypothetical protein
MTTRTESSTAEQFRALPLHDALLHELHLDWSARTCRMHLEVFVDLRETAVPRQLVFRSVTDVSIPHHAPWGQSIHINSSGFEPPDVFTLEMQSGDEIRIRAESFELATPKA